MWLIDRTCVHDLFNSWHSQHINNWSDLLSYKLQLSVIKYVAMQVLFTSFNVVNIVLPSE